MITMITSDWAVESSSHPDDRRLDEWVPLERIDFEAYKSSLLGIADTTAAPTTDQVQRKVRPCMLLHHI